MKPFLVTIAEQIVEKHPSNLRNVIIVVPGKRAGLFLRKHLAKILGKSFFAPKILTLPDFISLLSNKSTTSRLELIILLYEVYKNLMAENAEPFDVFSKWATTALSDFNDVEQSMVSAQTLYRDLRDIKEIENWSFNSTSLSESQESYLEFWNKLGTIYSAFRDAQLNKEKYSYALLTNLLAKSEPTSQIPTDVEDIWFVGLSNLSKAEQKIIDKLQEARKCTCRWDGDQYYYNNEMHEAGHFLRHHAKKQDIILGTDMVDSPKNITVYETTTPYSQALLIRDLIKDINVDTADKTAIIIADSTLLVPVIRNLPDIKCKVNIALGYPLKQTAIMKLIKSLMQLHTPQALKASRGTYYRHLLQVVEQQALTGFLGKEIKEIRHSIVSDVRIYIKESDLNLFVERFDSLKKITYLFAEENRQPLIWIKNVLQLLDELLIAEQGNEFEIECILRAQELLSEIPAIVETGEELTDMKSLQVIMQHLMSGEAITFTGEPLQGLQILNMVETRAIDFDHVIVIGANEDQLPGNLTDQSLIPFDVRKLYEMPTVADKEATYAYTLYRLIQRASKIDFLFSSITSDFKGTEQSRYITQLELELRSPYSQITRVKASLSGDNVEDKIVSILNDDFSKTRIKALWKAGISPSALNKYLICPLDFYYRYILGLGEEEEVEENISASTFGSVVHQVLEDFFKNHLNSFPSLDELEQFKINLPELLKAAFTLIYKMGDLTFGENYLQFSLAQKMLEKTIDFEISEVKKRATQGTTCIIAEIESSLNGVIPASKYGIDFEMNIRGKADRIDHEDSIVRIIDYKTGAVHSGDLQIKKEGIKGAFERTQSKLIQLLFYSYMESQKGTPVGNIRSALFSLKNYSAGWQYIDNGGSDIIDQATLEAFESEIVECAKSMLELHAFEHDNSSNHCEYCMR